MREGGLPEAIAHRLEWEDAAISGLRLTARYRAMNPAEVVRRLLARSKSGAARSEQERPCAGHARPAGMSQRSASGSAPGNG